MRTNRRVAIIGSRGSVHELFSQILARGWFERGWQGAVGSEEKAVVNQAVATLSAADPDPSSLASLSANELGSSSLGTPAGGQAWEPSRWQLPRPCLVGNLSEAAGSLWKPTGHEPFEWESKWHGGFEFEMVSELGWGANRIAQARQEQRPFAAAFVDLTQELEDAIPSIEHWLAIDPELQWVLCLPTSELLAAADWSARCVERFGHHERVVISRRPLADVETTFLTVLLTEKWRLMRELPGDLPGRVVGSGDTHRVLAVIDGCLEELAAAQNGQRTRSGELAQRLQRRTIEVLGTRDLTLYALAHLADSRDPETGEHLLRMRSYAQLLAEELSLQGSHAKLLDATFLENFYHCTPLHDIGKVCIPDQILLKPSALTRDEFEVMKQHTRIGAESLEMAARQQGEEAFFRMAATIARWHHERFDGSGYPDGLRGEAIPMAARITALADVFDALTSARVYKEAMDPLVARQIIEGEAGKHFDPVIVAAFARCFDRFVETRSTIDDTLGTPVIPLLWSSPNSTSAPWNWIAPVAARTPSHPLSRR